MSKFDSFVVKLDGLCSSLGETYQIQHCAPFWAQRKWKDCTFLSSEFFGIVYGLAFLLQLSVND